MTFAHALVDNQGDKLDSTMPGLRVRKDRMIPPVFSARFPLPWIPVSELVEPDPTQVIRKEAMPNNNNKSSFIEWV